MNLSTLLTIGFLVIIALIVFALAIYIGAIYNRFQQLKNGAEATFNQIKVAMKKRLDLLSELLESVKSYARYERDTFERVTKMRTEVMKASTPQDLQKIDAETRGLLGNIIVSVENYPELKTSSVVQELMSSAKSVEDEIARLRYTYNNVVQEYNTRMDIIPDGIIASLMGLKKLEYLHFEESVERRPELDWNV